MDPISQGAFAATAAQSLSNKKQVAMACMLGFLSGLAPDLDVLITSDVDPLLSLEFHRQFTHSLVFIPIGALICATLFYHLTPKRWRLTFRQTLIFCAAGFATHAFLDACTSYGTQLFWPFSDQRVSWSTISIIDPLFTLPVVVLILTSAILKKPNYARCAFAWIAIYLSIGLFQRERAETEGMALAESRGHNPVTVDAKPGFGNLLLWKTIYEFENRYYVDGFRMGVDIQTYPGESIDKLNVTRDFPWLDPSSQQARDIERFSWFSEGFVAVNPKNPNRVMDMRYSMLPNEIEALWMIDLDPNKGSDQHVGYVHEHNTEDDTLRIFQDMLLGK